MPETETESQRDRIAKEIQKRINQKNYSKDQAHKEVKRMDEFDGGYVTEVFEKFFVSDLKPRTDLQKEIIKVYDEDSSRSYVDIAKIVADNLNRGSVDQSLVSDYTSRFRNDFRHKTNLPGGLSTNSKNLGEKFKFTDDGDIVNVEKEKEEQEEQEQKKLIQNQKDQQTEKQETQKKEQTTYTLTDDERYEVLESLFQAEASEETIRKFLD